MYDRRVSGILLHPTSLPGPGGIGDLGDAAFRFVDWLADAKQRRWQLMPLGPTGYGDSPYAGLSALAGNPLLISLERLVRDGLLANADVAGGDDLPAGHVDFGAVSTRKRDLLHRAYETFAARASASQLEAFAEFSTEHATWLEPWALFAALKEAHGGVAWIDWDPAVARRQPAALAEWGTRLADQVRFQRFLQWLFARQWRDVKEYANERGIRIIGDIPIFVAHDSADVWAEPELFSARRRRAARRPWRASRPTTSARRASAGAIRSTAGTCMARARLRLVDRARSARTLDLVDIVRIDHFRGFAGYWEVPAAETTAVNGRWVPGPGEALFDAVRERSASCPIIAEDLGLITAGRRGAAA